MTQSLSRLAVALGAQINAHAIGNEITFGDSPDQQPNVVQNIDVSDLVALQSGVTAKSITSTPAMAQVTVLGVIIT
ncbi:MAG: hypothetical protein O3B92_00130 [Actinobacteria bacterium]|nr:hypothetical protein [Actinomycetota bacterium]MDA3016582.1 hypothetical protein [Actinomycetota bacterium]